MIYGEGRTAKGTTPKFRAHAGLYYDNCNYRIKLATFRGVAAAAWAGRGSALKTNGAGTLTPRPKGDRIWHNGLLGNEIN